MVNTVKVKQVVSSTLLGLGVILVLAGFIAALGFTASGLIASVAAIAALLYAGAVWFTPPASALSPAPPHASPLVVFDRDQRIVSGSVAGQPVASTFPHIIRPEIERRCAVALSGTSARFACLIDGRTTIFDALPVRNGDGVIVYGILLTSETAPAAIAATASPIAGAPPHAFDPSR